MPLTLILRSSNLDADKAAPALTFDGPRIVIGRGVGCEVRLPDPSVSHRHATVRANGPSYQLVDEGSTNGTFVGGVRLAPQTPRAVKSGDLIRVGRVWLEARVDQTPPTRDIAIATRDLALALVSQAMRALGDDAVTKVRIVEGADLGAVLALEEEGRAYVVGRDERCDLPIADADASREHAQFVRRGGTVLVRDMGSKNGVVLGQSRIPPDRDLLWRAGTLVRLGKTVLTLDEPAAAALAALEDAEDEPIDAEDIPPMPPTSSKLPLGPPGTGTGGAPIADIVNTPKQGMPATRIAPKHRWSATDLAVVAAALVVMALSIAGLVWLLRG
jgi:pSer/pThr/pTyr-binding forkhead associated (FHA) protein